MKNSLFKSVFSKVSIGLICLFYSFFILTCKKENKTEVPPEISNISISKDTIRQDVNPGNDFFFYSFTLDDQFGEPGFQSESDTLFVTFKDLRIDPPFPITYYVSPSHPNTSVQINNGAIEITVWTTCCTFDFDYDNYMPCEAEPDYFESLPYEVEFRHSLGYELPKDMIELTIDCSFD